MKCPFCPMVIGGLNQVLEHILQKHPMKAVASIREVASEFALENVEELAHEPSPEAVHGP